MTSDHCKAVPGQERHRVSLRREQPSLPGMGQVGVFSWGTFTPEPHCLSLKARKPVLPALPVVPITRASESMDPFPGHQKPQCWGLTLSLALLSEQCRIVTVSATLASCQIFCHPDTMSGVQEDNTQGLCTRHTEGAQCLWTLESWATERACRQQGTRLHI